MTLFKIFSGKEDIELAPKVMQFALVTDCGTFSSEQPYSCYSSLEVLGRSGMVFKGQFQVQTKTSKYYQITPV